MFILDKFIADAVTMRPVSMFKADIEANSYVSPVFFCSTADITVPE